MIENLARMIIEAQRIHLESWKEESERYEIKVQQAINLAGGTSGLDERANDLVSLLLMACWSDAEDWAERVLAKPRYRNEAHNACCHFLGNYEEHDLYFCQRLGPGHTRILTVTEDNHICNDIAISIIIDVGMGAWSRAIGHAIHLARVRRLI